LTPAPCATARSSRATTPGARSAAGTSLSTRSHRAQEADVGAIVAVVIVIVALGLAWHWFRQWEIQIEVRKEEVRPYHPPMDLTITRRAAEILAARAEWGKEHPEKIPDHP